MEVNVFMIKGKKDEAINDLKLTSIAIESITERLNKLVTANGDIATLAYAGEVEVGFCGCKGGCDGGCTSW